MPWHSLNDSVQERTYRLRSMIRRFARPGLESNFLSFANPTISSFSNSARFSCRRVYPDYAVEEPQPVSQELDRRAGWENLRHLRP